MKTMKQWVADALTLSATEKRMLIAYGEKHIPYVFNENEKDSFHDALASLFVWDEMGGTRYWMDKIAKEEEAELFLYELSAE